MVLTASSRVLSLAIIVLAPLPLAGASGLLPSPVRDMGLQLPIIFVSAGVLWLHLHVQPTTSRVATRRWAWVDVYLVFVVWAVTITLVIQGPSLKAILPWVVSALLYRVIGRQSSAVLPDRAALTALATALTAMALMDLFAARLGLPAAQTASMNSTLDASGLVSTTRNTGLLGDWELLPEVLAICIIVLCWLGATARSKGGRLAATAGVAVCLVDGISANTRGPAILLVPAAGAILLLSARRFRKRLVVIVCLVGVGVWIASTIQLFADVPILARISSASTEGSLAVRLNRTLPWDAILARPEFWSHLWTGNGLDYPFQNIGIYPHSLPFTLIYGCGIVGLALLGIALCAVLIGHLRQCLRDRRGANLPMLTVWLLFCLDEVKIEFTRLPILIVTFGVMLGISRAIISRERDPMVSSRPAPNRDLARNFSGA
jgi:hypothetical protein